MTDEIEARLEIGMAATVDDARREIEAWASMRHFIDNQGGVKEYPILRILAEEHYCRWQREEQLRRKALQAYKEAKDGE